jgi:hypothetical protein
LEEKQKHNSYYIQVDQRGTIYTEDKSLGRLCKMCDPFRVIPQGFQLVCYTATLFSTEVVDKRIDPDRHLAHLSRRRRAGPRGAAEMRASAKYSCWEIELALFT